MAVLRDQGFFQRKSGQFRTPAQIANQGNRLAVKTDSSDREASPHLASRRTRVSTGQSIVLTWVERD